MAEQDGTVTSVIGMFSQIVGTAQEKLDDWTGEHAFSWPSLDRCLVLGGVILFQVAQQTVFCCPGPFRSRCRVGDVVREEFPALLGARREPSRGHITL